MDNALYFLEKAAQCRRMADGIYNRDDPAVSALMALAEEFEANAAAFIARGRAAHAIGVGDDIAPIGSPASKQAKP